MTVEELCNKYHTYSIEDWDEAWEQFVYEENDPDTTEENATMLGFLKAVFDQQTETEARLLKNEENALNILISWINAILKYSESKFTVSGKGKTMADAVKSAMGKLWKYPTMNFPESITINKGSDGKYLCEIRRNIFYSKKFGEFAMKMIDKNRFDQPSIARLYAAKCGDLQAIYNIGLQLSSEDYDYRMLAISNLSYFSFPDRIVKALYTDKAYSYTLTPITALYWFYLGAELGGEKCRYFAAKDFLKKEAYPLCAKYMLKLANYDNDYRAEAELTLLNILTTHNIHPSVISSNQKADLIGRLVDKYAANPPLQIEKPAYLALAEYAYIQKKFRTSINFYRKAGINSPDKIGDIRICSRIGDMLFLLNDTDAIPWLEKSLTLNTFFRHSETPEKKETNRKIAKLYLSKWKKHQDKKDASQAASHLQKSNPTADEMAMLLDFHLKKIITLRTELIEEYAQKCIHILTAPTACDLGNMLWNADRSKYKELPEKLMRRAISLNESNSAYWYHLGMISAYDTLYGNDFSASKLKEATEHFEKARQYGNILAILRLSDCCWHSQKEGFPQDFPRAKELLLEFLEKCNVPDKYYAYLRLARISMLENQPFEITVGYLSKAHKINVRGLASIRIKEFFGDKISEYIQQLKKSNLLQRKMNELFCENADFLYAIALQLELSGDYYSAIELYGCSASMGSKKAVYTLYNMAKQGTNYFNKKGTDA